MENTLPHNFLVLLLLLLHPLFFFISSFKGRNDQTKPNFPPGPPKLPIIGNLHQLIAKQPHQALSQLSNIYGPVMLLQYGRVPTVVISSVEAAEQVLKTLDVVFCNRIQLAGRKRLSYNYVDMALAPHGEYWREVRKICVLELYSKKRVQSFKAVRAEEVAVVIDSISFSSNTTPVNVFEKLTSFTHKTICRVAFGSTTGQSRSRNHFDNGRLIKVLCEVAALTSLYASDFYPEVSWIIDRITGIHGKKEKCFQDLDNFLQQIIDEHDNRPERLKPEQEDIIDVLLKLKKDHTSTIHLTDDHIKAIVLNVYLGGVDTTTGVMTWVMAELAKNPEAMKKVQEEIRSYVGSKGKVEESDLDNFSFLKMVIKETLRLHPILPLLARKSMIRCKIDGYDIYPSTWILINSWALGRNPQYWKNPEKFLPERFKDSSLDFVENQKFEYMPFGGGRRICPGLNMGIVLTELVLANILYTFDWEFPKGLKAEDLNMEESSVSRYPLELVPIKYVAGKSD
ncbi:cytochrome P450 71B26-like [Papaver somniferum]|uniref:cytochrome P450 71B26-like n=1 Tax=Papaver somniferum TaxID=3469 RepID=UPI000E6FE0DE|nr:cytochrome P450 71B26-like [Papaver somniferum]